MDNAIEQLQELGFGQYEAQAYVALLQHHPLNGYELARTSAVPRANIYTVLQKLEQRGAVVRLDAQDGTRYTPLPPEELIRGLRAQMQSSLDDAQLSLCSLKIQAEPEHIWNVRGYPLLLEHARAVIGAAQDQLTVAISPNEAPALSGDLEQAEARGVSVTTLCLAGCPHECAACRGQIYRYHLAPRDDRRYLLVVPDDSEMLAGEIGPGEQVLAVRTRQKLLVDLSAWHIRNSIALAAILSDLGDRLEGLLTPETRAILGSVGKGELQGSWLEYMRQLLNLPESKTMTLGKNS